MRSDQIRLRQVRSSEGRSDKVKTGHVRSSQVRSIKSHTRSITEVNESPYEVLEKSIKSHKL